MTERYVRVVNIWIHKGQEQAFEAFEREAALRMARHDGRIDAAVRTALPGPAGGLEESTPYEVHIVSFPDKAAADAYANDPETQALMEKRAGIISLTVVLAGRDAGPY